MSNNLRIALTRSQLAKRKGNSKWAPGAWQAAAKYYATANIPERRIPVIISADGAFPSPEALKEFFHLLSVPQVAPTTKTTLRPLKDTIDEEISADLQVTDVSMSQYRELKRRTEGNLVVIWFCGERRYAWFARSLKNENKEE